MNTLRIIGDVHCKIESYLKIAKDAESQGITSLQIGDLSFNYDFFKELSPTLSFAIRGNHDNPDLARLCPNFLGDYGIWESPIGSIFYLAGENSIDKEIRTPGLNYWYNEELTFEKLKDAMQMYCSVKPDILVSHGCCSSLIRPFFGPKMWQNKILTPSLTAKFLDIMVERHRPRLHVFGHFHSGIQIKLRGTEFVCLPELGWVDIDENLNIKWGGQ